LAVGWMPGAFGGVGGTLTGTVAPLGGVTNVTYSIESPKVMDTYVGYSISLGNTTGGTATATNTSFTVTATASDTQEVVKLLLNADVVLPAGCTATAVNSFTCIVGQLKAGQSFPPFQVFFRAPTKVINGSFDDVDPDSTADNDYVKVQLTWHYAERTNDQNPNTNSSGSATDASVLLGTPNPTQVKSTVPKTGGEFFTGGAVATGGDNWTTTVVVPATTSFTTAEITETAGVPVAPTLLNSSTTTLSIPGTFQKLIITLRRDASTIVKGAKIASARLYYDNPTTPAPGVTYPYEVLPCTDTTHGTLPKPGIPCINRRTEYTKKTAPAPDWEGDWEFEVFALDNGRYVN